MNKAEIREALAAATPGPWEANVHNHGAEVTVSDSPYGWICQLWYKDEEAMQNYENNSRLIANAPEWIRQLLDENERLEQANRDLRRQNQRYRKQLTKIYKKSPH